MGANKKPLRIFEADRAVVVSGPEIKSGPYAGLAQYRADDTSALDVLVDGVHCAGCIQKIESRLKSRAEIIHARLNFSSKRLSLVWQGLPAQADTLVDLVTRLGYSVRPFSEDAAQKSSAEFERFLLVCIGVSGFAMGNIMMLSVGLWMAGPEEMGQGTRDFMHWLSALIALPAVVYSGLPFFRSAFKALRGGHTNMDVPISVGVILACAGSLYETWRSGQHVYFDSAVMLLFFLLIGRYFDARARRHARSAATDLLQSFTGFAQVEDAQGIRPVLIRDVLEGMIVRVAVGEKFPVDGVVLSGQSSVDTSLVTGETVPRSVAPNDSVYAGTLNLTTPVRIRVAHAADESLLADIVRLMEKAGQGQAAYVRLADRVAKMYTPVVHILAVLAFILWYVVLDAGFAQALLVASTVLIITCPCALGLAVPVVQVLATGRLMKKGILVKSGDALERLAKVDTVMLDKTGTLTLGTPQFVGQVAPDDLQLAASLASYSAHPLAQAVRAAYTGDLISLTHTEEFSGQGVAAQLNGRMVRLGARAWCGDAQAPATEFSELWLDRGDSQNPVVLTFADTLRPDVQQVLGKLKNKGISLVLASGDRAPVVTRIAQALNIATFYADQTPPQKFALLSDLRTQGKNILMIGDGLNDAPTLAGADVSIAPGTALDMAQNAADVIFMGESFKPVIEVYETAQLSQVLVHQNFVLSILYNIISIPLAFAGLVTPMIAAIAMSASSLIVILNAFRLNVRT